MSEYDLLKAQQKELTNMLDERIKAIAKGYPDNSSRRICKTKFRRLRLQIQDIMLSIERQFRDYALEREMWYKDEQ